MGTRHIVKAIDKNGNTVLQQYAQWDGYASGQGAEMLDILHRNIDNKGLDDFIETLNKSFGKLKKVTMDEASEITKDFVTKSDDFKEQIEEYMDAFPSLSRDTSVRIFEKLLDPNTSDTIHTVDAIESNFDGWCEYMHTLDLQNLIYRISTYEEGGYEDEQFELDLRNLPSFEAFEQMIEETEGAY